MGQRRKDKADVHGWETAWSMAAVELEENSRPIYPVAGERAAAGIMELAILSVSAVDKTGAEEVAKPTARTTMMEGGENGASSSGGDVSGAGNGDDSIAGGSNNGEGGQYCWGRRQWRQGTFRGAVYNGEMSGSTVPQATDCEGADNVRKNCTAIRIDENYRLLVWRIMACRHLSTH